MHAGPDGYPVDIQPNPRPSVPRSLSVSWGEVPRALRNGFITQYDIRYEPLETYDGNIGTRSITVHEDEGREVALLDLEEDTQYNVSIRAYTVVGEGPFSEQVTGRTSEGGECMQCSVH